MTIYKRTVIDGFAHKALGRYFETGARRGLPQEMVERIAAVLAAIDSAPTIEALNRPSFRLHQLKGDLNGFWSVTVRANWRIIFRFEDGIASDVDLVDYH
jgi:toxin HigB-1